MAEIKFTPEALADLKEIKAYILDSVFERLIQSKYKSYSRTITFLFSDSFPL